MISHNCVKSLTKPKYMEITAASVIIATNIVEYEEIVNNETVIKYKYDCVVYNKDEYLTILAISTNQVINQLYDEIEVIKGLLNITTSTIAEWNNINSYQIGDKVQYNGKIWESTIANNIWTPGALGWIEVNI